MYFKIIWNIISDLFWPIDGILTLQIGMDLEVMAPKEW